MSLSLGAVKGWLTDSKRFSSLSHSNRGKSTIHTGLNIVLSQRFYISAIFVLTEPKTFKAKFELSPIIKHIELSFNL